MSMLRYSGCILPATIAVTSAASAQSEAAPSSALALAPLRPSVARTWNGGRRAAAVSFSPSFYGSSPATPLSPQSTRGVARRSEVSLCRSSETNDDAERKVPPPSFLSTSKASVSFKSSGGDRGSSPSNLSAVDRLLLILASDRTSLLLGSVGIIVLLLNRLISFPEDAAYEASRSRIDLLGVFAAGSVLLNGITKLDVESARAERVSLQGENEESVTWIEGRGGIDAEGFDKFRSTVEWALSSFLKCSPARTAVLLSANPLQNRRWEPIASVGVLPEDTQLRVSIPDSISSTPILDRMLLEDGNIKGGTVSGAEVAGTASRKGRKESYLPNLQALPGRVEFTYLPPNAQEALILPVVVPGNDDEKDRSYYAVVLGGDTARSFTPRDIAWCREICLSWLAPSGTSPSMYNSVNLSTDGRIN